MDLPRPANITLWAFAGERHLLRLCQDPTTKKGGFRRRGTTAYVLALARSCKAIVSFSGVMNVLCTRNLSLHFEFSGGSSFRGCNITEDNKKGLSMVGDAASILLPETSTLSPGSTRPEFGRTQYNYVKRVQEDINKQKWRLVSPLGQWSWLWKRLAVNFGL